MPVVTLYHSRLQSMLRRKNVQQIIDALPYIGLDIEEQAGDYVRVEYNPNRPDFSTDYGIVRALKGILNIEKGTPKFRCGRSNVAIRVDRSVNGVRPFIVSLLAMNGKLDDEGIRQVIAMQEDIHAGIGRKRRKVSIGIHNYDAIKPPLLYTTEVPSFRFMPLDADDTMSMQQVLDTTDTGREYARILAGKNRYPIIKDSLDNVLSFPPIINSELTRVTENTKNLLIDVTATELKAAEDALAIIAVTLHDAGFKISSVKLDYPNRKLETPNMKPLARSVSKDYANGLLGLELSAREIARCLQRSRVGAAVSRNKITCQIPRYRLDILHEVDLVEDVAIGYGINRMSPTFPESTTSGARNSLHKVLDDARQVLVGLGMLEVMNFSLVSRQLQYSMVNRPEQNILAVEQTKSIEHEVLRDSLIPSLLSTLAGNIHEPYPQRIFEVGKTFFASGSGIDEYWTVGAAIAHKDANYTEAKSYMQSLLRTLLGIEAEAAPVTNAMLADGRGAKVSLQGKNAGIIGEVSQKVVDSLKLRVPVSVFEVNLSVLLES